MSNEKSLYDFYEEMETVTLSDICTETSLDELAIAIANIIPEHAIETTATYYGLDKEKLEYMFDAASDKLAFHTINYLKIEPIPTIAYILLQNIPEEDAERWHYRNTTSKIGDNLQYVNLLMLEKLATIMKKKLKSKYTAVNKDRGAVTRP